MSKSERVLSFCSSHEKVIIYGAGLYARALLRFLGDEGISPESCLISGKAQKGSSLNGELDIHSFDDYSIETPSSVGVIISMQPRFHGEVMSLIRSRYGDDIDCFLMGEDDLIDVENRNLLSRFHKTITKECDLSKEEEDEYIARIRHIYNIFSGVKLHFLCMRSIGAAGDDWIRFVEDSSNKSDKFYLCYPVSDLDDDMLGVNSFFLSKCTVDKGEVLCWHNLKFWSYFYACDKDFFSFDGKLYSYSNSVEKINTFFDKHDFNQRKTYISFNEQETDEGDKRLNEMGICGDYVCFSARDDAYYRKVLKWQSDTKILMDKYRNQKIENIRPAMEHLASNGIKAIRMGAEVNNKIDWDNTVDYASNYRSEFMDFYLMSRCMFLVSNASGIQSIASIFSKPLVIISSPFFTLRGDVMLFSDIRRDLWIYRKYYSPEKGRFLYLSELLRYETNESMHSFTSIGTARLYERDGIIMQENSPEEIDDVVQEMVMRINGEMEYTKEDEEMQEQFQSILHSVPLGRSRPYSMRVSRNFIRQNQWLLR